MRFACLKNIENPALPSLSEGETVAYTYATDDEDTVFARVKPSCSMNKRLYFLISTTKRKG